MLKRLLGVLLALAGLVPLGLGTWFATKLGTTGTASFRVDGDGKTPLLITPHVLNRTDLPVRIAVEGAGSGAYAVIGTPSDVAAALAGAARREVTGIEVADWRAPVTRTGSGPVGQLRELDMWRQVTSLEGATTMTVEQASAPESVLIVPGSGAATTTLRWANSTWFYQALVLAAAGALLTTVGWLLARPARRPKGDEDEHADELGEDAPDEDPALAHTAGPAGATDPAAHQPATAEGSTSTQRTTGTGSGSTRIEENA